MRVPLLDSVLSSVEKDIDLAPGSTVVVGMSGGVDSAVTALLLKELGYDVVALFMKNWDDDESSTSQENGASKKAVCPAEQDWHDVVQTAAYLKIPAYSISFAKEYREEVFEGFLLDLKRGLTPNPDILCNREIKFKHLLRKALSFNAKALATGHYARRRVQSGQAQLLRGIDSTKDQSYFLYAIPQEALQMARFPLGSLPKSTVRQVAEQYKLPVAKKRDSTGICFIGKRDFRPFVAKYLGFTPGKIISDTGCVVGEHQGVAFYTLGQRKGLQIGGPGDAWFVIKKIPEENLLVVAQGDDHPALYSNRLVAEELSWISGFAPVIPLQCSAKIRYRHEDTACTVLPVSQASTPQPASLAVEFQVAQRAITPRQSIVFYQGEVCLGGGMIAKDYD